MLAATGACSPRAAEREVAACLARKLQRAKAGHTQILVQHADHTAADDIAWAHHGVRRNRHAAGERLELNDAERVGPARKYEHVRRCHQTGELSAFAQAEERHIRESPSQICLLRPLADHDFRARQIKREESLDILLKCDAACGEKDRTRQVERDHTVRREQVRIDAARPHAQVLEAALA